jgi:hypothetical protein
MHGISDKQPAFFVADSHSLTWTRSHCRPISLSNQGNIVENIQYWRLRSVKNSILKFGITKDNQESVF